MRWYYSACKELKDLWAIMLMHFPGYTGNILRYLSYRKRFKACGKNISISPFVSFKGLEFIELGSNVSFGELCSIYALSDTKESLISIGSDVSFNRNVMINADVKGKIIIEDNVLVGPNAVIRASGHRYDKINAPIRKQGHKKGTIHINRDVWIGANAVILPNVVIGTGAVVGAGAVVTKDVYDFDIVGGVPAKHIKNRIKDQLE